LKDYLGEKNISFTEKIIDQDPDHIKSLNNLAWLLRESDPLRAFKYAERALNLTPDDPNILDTLGIIEINRGHGAQAVRYIRRALKIAPMNLTFRYHLAKAVAMNGDKEEAKTILKEILEPDNSFFEMQQASSLLKELSR
jgi:Flp pilus assembly protein TadD